jgi:hypothetical protein
MTRYAPIQALQWRHALQSREPAAGFASRLAALNGVGLGTFLRDMGIQHRGLDHGTEEAVRDVAALGGLADADAAALRRYTPRRLADERACTVAAERFGPGSVHRTYFRICPHCVAEDLARFEGPRAARPWLRLEWLIDHVRSCGRHQVALMDTKPIRRRFQTFDFAETIGAQVLPELDRLTGEAGRAPRSAYEDWIVARIDGTRDPANWLDDVPLSAGIAFCEGLGVSAIHPPKVRTAGFGRTEWAAAGAEGFLVASRGEDSVRELLERLVGAQAGTRGVLGLRDTYGYVYGLLHRAMSDPGLEKFRDAVRRHAFDTLPLEPGTDVLGVELEARRVHTVRSASLVSGAHSRTIRRMLVRKGVPEAAKGSGLRDHRVTVRAEEVEAALTKLKDAMTAPAVIEATGIPRLHLRSMIAQGFLATLTDSHKEAHAKHRVARTDVDALMQRLFAGAEQVGAPTGRQMTIMAARLAATASVDDIVGFVLRGELRWKGRLGREPRYEHLLVDADEITALIRKEPAMSGLTKAEVERLVPGIGTTSVNGLVALNVLDTAQEFSPEARRLVRVITRESAEAFRDRYVALGELCEWTGLHHKKVRQHLRQGGIEEAFPYESAGAFFYVRREIAGISALAGATATKPKGARASLVTRL